MSGNDYSKQLPDWQKKHKDAKFLSFKPKRLFVLCEVVKYLGSIISSECWGQTNAEAVLVSGYQGPLLLTKATSKSRHTAWCSEILTFIKQPEYNVTDIVQNISSNFKAKILFEHLDSCRVDLYRTSYALQ